MTSIDHQHDHLLYKIVYLVTVIQYRYMYVHGVFDVDCIEINGFKSVLNVLLPSVFNYT